MTSPTARLEAMRQLRLDNISQIRDNDPVSLLTWRTTNQQEIEALTLALDALREVERLKALADSIDEDGKRMSFASLMDSIDSRQTQDRVYEYCAWQHHKVDRLEAQLEARTKERVDDHLTCLGCHHDMESHINGAGTFDGHCRAKPLCGCSRFESVVGIRQRVESAEASLRALREQAQILVNNWERRGASDFLDFLRDVLRHDSAAPTTDNGQP